MFFFRLNCFKFINYYRVKYFFLDFRMKLIWILTFLKNLILYLIYSRLNVKWHIAEFDLHSLKVDYSISLCILVLCTVIVARSSKTSSMRRTV